MSTAPDGISGSELLARQMRDEGVEDLFYIMGGPIIEVAGFAADFAPLHPLHHHSLLTKM